MFGKIMRIFNISLLLAMAAMSPFVMASSEENEELINYLNAIEGMVATASEAQRNEGYLSIDVEYIQPVDHDHPTGEKFTQKISLFHKSKNSPMILKTRGYSMSWYSLGLFSQEKQANQLSVEHRYYGGSIPESYNQDYLNIEQASEDLHRIVSAIRPFYEGKWLSTGSSKGGMTAMFYRYFYPNDVDATLANVAPLSIGRKDFRYDYFVRQVGTEQCRAKIMDAQRMMLQSRQEIKDYLATITWHEFTYEKMGYDNALDYAVAEFYFQFFQYFPVSYCEELPVAGSSIEDLVNQILLMLYQNSDSKFADGDAYAYQAYTQLGHPKLPTEHIDDLLRSDPNDYSNYMENPPSSDVFDYSMIPVMFWTFTQANNVMTFYGDNDPWSAAKFPIYNSVSRDNHTYNIAEGTHSSSIYSLEGEEKVAADSVIDRWLGIETVQTLNKLNSDKTLLGSKEKNQTDRHLKYPKKINSVEQLERLIETYKN